jgi:hypothetical protein
LNTSLVTNAVLKRATPEISAKAALTKKSNIANAKQQKELKGTQRNEGIRSGCIFPGHDAAISCLGITLRKSEYPFLPHQIDPHSKAISALNCLYVAPKYLPRLGLHYLLWYYRCDAVSFREIRQQFHKK